MTAKPSPSMHHHVVWQMPLQGRRLIEASAGTGKTWTLSGLVVRLVLGLRDLSQPSTADDPGWTPALLPHQVLVVTFTEAATAELRERIQKRLTLALQAFGPDDAQAAATQDPLLLALREHVHPQHWPEAQRRVSAALANLDEAAIHTLHGWALRTLKRHAFESGQAFGAEPVPDPQALHLQAVQHHWRTHWSTWPVGAWRALTTELARSPEHLLTQVKPLWQAHERDPHHPWPVSDDWAAEPALQALAQWHEQLHQLQKQARAAFDDAAVEALHDAVARKAIKNYQMRWWPPRLAELRQWQQGQALKPDRLAYWGSAFLLERAWAPAADWPLFSAIQAVCDHLTTHPTDLAPALLAHAARATWQDLQARKLALDQFEFNDLLRRLHQACHDPNSDFCEQVRAQYPVALVDEFQDTDPWQYESLAAIYPDPEHHDWVMIGDPKQSIYRFRGADLPTYRRARDTALTLHTLEDNHRSTPDLVNALNHVFQVAQANWDDAASAQVRAARHNALGLNQGQHPAITVTQWQAPVPDDADAAPPKPPSVRVLETHLAEWAAEALVTDVQQGLYAPAQVAVLVRHQGQARLMAQALLARGVNSIYLSDRNSVLAEPVAQSVWRVLCAIDQPHHLGLLRAAMATDLWALPVADWPHHLQSDQALEAAQALTQSVQQRWQRQGVLAALQHWLMASGAAARLLAQPQGERLLSQCLHVADWLQMQSTQAVGRTALLRRLSEAMAQPNPDDASAQARLHTDTPCVTLLTVHKSKGLEYDVVFVPFLSTLSKSSRADEALPVADDADAEPDGAGSDDGDDPSTTQAEDLRLIYVALTRARQHLWLGVGEVKGEFGKDQPSAWCALLGRQGPGDLATTLRAQWPTQAVMHRSVEGDAPRHVWQAPTPSLTHAASAAPRRSGGRWQVSSFSALTRQLDDSELLRSADEGEWQPDSTPPVAIPAPRAGSDPFEGLGAGRAFGVVIHELLEWQFNQGWPLVAQPANAPSTAQSQAWASRLQAATLSLGLPPAAAPVLAQALAQLIQTPTPWGSDAAPGALSDLRAPQAWAEMPFVLGLHHLNVQAFDDAVTQAICPGLPRPRLQASDWSGLLSGVMDLVFAWPDPSAGGERYAILDYKTNRIDGQHPNGLTTALLAHRYDVQAVIYAWALHRLLRHRVPNYHFSQHVAGAWFWFVRGGAAGWQQVVIPASLMAWLDAMDPASPEGHA